MLVGPALAAQLTKMILAEIAEMPVKLVPAETLNLQVRQDVANALGQHLRDPAEEEDEGMRPLKKLRRTKEAKDEIKAAKTSQVLWRLKNRVAATRATETLSSAADLMAVLTSSSSSSSGSSGSSDPFREMSSRMTLYRHMLLLDGAVDRCLSDQLWSLREKGQFAGLAFATDESPPSQPRFRGLRFQITAMYWGTFLPVADWASSRTAPILKTTCLGDIMHCPGKKGVDVSRVLEKQLARVGLNCFDVVSGTGDGGGENEGHQGVHSYFENLQPGYVRRRCLPHLSWRTCDCAIRPSGLDYKALAAYFCEGVTWSRLRDCYRKPCFWWP